MTSRSRTFSMTFSVTFPCSSTDFCAPRVVGLESRPARRYSSDKAERAGERSLARFACRRGGQEHEPLRGHAPCDSFPGELSDLADEDVHWQLVRERHGRTSSRGHGSRRRLDGAG